jgi:agmatine/peptidylarginine deiminase
MTNVEIIITAVGLIGSLIGIYEFGGRKYNDCRKKPLTQLMNELADKNTPLKRQKAILRKISKGLICFRITIPNEYIKTFNAEGKGKLNIFRDICTRNNIEPTRELCIKMLGSDDAQFRKEWYDKQTEHHALETDTTVVTSTEQSPTEVKETMYVVYLSGLLASKFPTACKRLTDLLDKYGITYKFLDGTKDVWCRDYMPVQNAENQLVQFKYDPSYLKGNPEYEASRSDVRYVDEVNGLKPIFSNINLDGGNVVMLGNKSIISDRVFDENPEMNRDDIRKQLAELLKAQIIIISALARSYDFTGHADGMIRFVNENTVIGNELTEDSQTFKDKMKRAMRMANLTYIEFPYFNYDIKGNQDHAIGVYLNYLEVGNLIIMPVFGVPGNRDAEALAKLKEVFPNKTIETIDYNEVALQGGILNCTTWVMRE